MKLTITDCAAEWYKKELDLSDGDKLRFYARYGGCGIVSGFSLGVKTAEPSETLTQSSANGIEFFVESDDAWYFDGKNLHIDIPEQADEPRFDYN